MHAGVGYGELLSVLLTPKGTVKVNKVDPCGKPDGIGPAGLALLKGTVNKPGGQALTAKGRVNAQRAQAVLIGFVNIRVYAFEGGNAPYDPPAGFNA